MATMKEGRTGWLGHALLVLSGVAVLAALVARAGITRGLVEGSWRGAGGRRPHRVLRVWDWWSPSSQEEYAAYFGAVKQAFEQDHPDVEVVFQFVPFGQYQQKMTTALVGNSPPDVFQSSVYWAEGLYDQGALLSLNPFLERERAERAGKRALGLPIDTGQIVDQEAYLAAAWRHNTKVDGTVFGIPQVLDSSALLWNTGLLRRAAQDNPEIRAMFEHRPDGSTDYERLRFDAIRDWSQFRRVALALTRRDPRGDIEQAGFAIHAHGSGAEPLMPWCAANGTNFQDAAGTRALFDNAAGIEAIRFVLDLYWTDRVSPPFRQQIDDEEVFDQGKVACVSGGTWSPRYVVRDTEGRIHCDLTPFPPGPHGAGPTTQTWGNMLVISRRSIQPDLAWEYIKCVTSLRGALRLLKYTDWNSPRRDFYSCPEWTDRCARNPALHNIAAICSSGKKLRHTQINAVNYVTASIFETLMLHYPLIVSGHGTYPSVDGAVREAAGAANRVYRRYNEQVAFWHRSHPDGEAAR